MSLGIKWGSNDEPDKPSGFIYFDAVSSYTQEYRGQVTKHPVDKGASVTDHFIKDNPVFNISGVITGMDISAIPSLIRDIENNSPLNSQQQPNAVEVQTQDIGLLQFLPDSVGQFLNFGKPTVKVQDTTFRVDSTEYMKDLLIKLLDGVIYNEKTQRFDSYIQVVSLYEFDGTIIKNIKSDLVLTNFRVNEDETTGDALYFDATLEGVKFVTLEKAQLPSDVINAAKTKKKSKADSTPKDVDESKTSGDSTAPKKDSSALKQLGAKVLSGASE